MKTVRVSHPTKKVDVTIQLPSSKSISNRALILRAISKNKIKLKNISTADDTLIMQKYLLQKSGIINVKNAGTCMRFLTAYFASANCEIELHGDERMCERPIKVLVDALKFLGADISYLNVDGFPPLKIKGRQLTGGKIKLDASVSSQFVSALMLVAPTFKNDLEIELVGKISSHSYIKMTEKLMTYLGFDCSFIRNKITIKNHQIIKPSNYKIEPDWSSASYWYEIAALSIEANILLKNVSLKSLQGDFIISEYMKNFGVETIETDEGIRLKKFNRKAAKIKSIKTINLLNTPDIAPTLVVTATAKNVDIKFSGLKNLKIKESNRLISLETELKKIGFSVEAKSDSIVVRPISGIQQPPADIQLQTYNDHRLAMSFAPLALLFDEVIIGNPDVVEKSYPKFWDNLKLAEFEITNSMSSV